MGAGCSGSKRGVAPLYQPGQHAFAELSDSDSTRQHLAQLSGQMKAMKELLETQGALLRQLDAERQRNSDLVEQIRELKLENTRVQLEGAGCFNLPGMDILEDLPPSGSRSVRSSRGGSKDGAGTGMLQLVGHASHGVPMLYMASWKEMVLFKGLSEPNMQAMIKRMKVKSFKDGEKIVEQGTIGTTMYFIDLGGARAIVGETVAQTLASGDFFGEMTFAYTCNKILKGSADEGEGSESMKRSCDVVAVGSTRCLELSVKDFLGVLKDDLLGSREALRAITNMAPLIDKRRQTVRAIKDGSFHESSSSADESDIKQREKGKSMRAHAGYAQDIILADGAQEIARRRMEKSMSTGSKSRRHDSDGAYHAVENFVPGHSAAQGKGGSALGRRRSSGWSGRNLDLDTTLTRGQGSASASKTSSKANSRSSSRQASPRDVDRPSTSSSRSTLKRNSSVF